MKPLSQPEPGSTRNSSGRRAAIFGTAALALIPAVEAAAKDADAELHGLISDYIAFRSSHEPGYRADLLRVARGEPIHRTVWQLGTQETAECFTWEELIGEAPATTPHGLRMKALLVAERFKVYRSGGFTMAGGLAADVLRQGGV